MDDTRAQLIEMWQYLIEWIGRFGVVFPQDDRQGDAFKARHRAALQALIEEGDLPTLVAEQLQAAFDEVVSHIWHSQATCYLAYPLEAFPREDLLARAKALGDLETDLDSETVAQARVAIERDMAFFQGKPRDQHLSTLWQSGEIAVGQATRAAAQFLLELLLEERS
jgi:hypothetical protein